MKSLSLFGVLLLARILILVGRDLPLSFWSPLAYLWQDLLVVLVFAGLERITTRRPWISWIVYGMSALYVAINVPLFRLMSSPMTTPMLHATRGALADSIRHHLTGENLILMGLILCAACVLPVLLGSVQLRPRVGLALTIAVLALAAPGPFAAEHVDTRGFDRNVFVALVQSAVPRVAAEPIEGRWRTSPYGPTGRPDPPRHAREDLARWKGAAKGRNVVLILLESTGAKYLKPYGAREDPMPNLSALAGQSILFENAYAVYPESIKGLFSVLCSRYPALDTQPEVCAKIATPSIASRLEADGFHTALFHSGRFLYLGMEEIVRHRGFQTLEDAGDIGGDRQSSFGVDEPATVERILNWVDSLPKGGTFFLTYLPVAGHHPYDFPGPGKFPGNDDFARYLNALHYSDAAMGELFEGFKARDLFEKTLFVILGDHGEAFGRHEGNYGHTLFIYDENIHVPFCVAAPGLIREQVRVGRVASLIDTAPTDLDLLGARIPDEYQGRSLLEPGGEMALFFADYSLALLGLRDGRWKFIHELGSGRSRLFDLTCDDRETENLSAQYPERVKVYREHLKRWAAAQRDLILHPRDCAVFSKR